ncbi:MAG TPA: 2-dehydropantoate 2-reductase [Alphaproteobacteria bacterium]|nr:2-dehydropantoate 2-reductase [Alphaproteobacteria bacterium]
MRICIAGVGAVGSVIAAYLSAAEKHEVSLLARGEALAAIRKNGLKVESRGKHLESRPKASDNAADLGPQDAVIVAVKGYSVPALAPALKPLIAKDTLVVTAQNGIPWWWFYGAGGGEGDRPFETVDPGAVAWREIGPEHAVGCIVTIPSTKIAPGVAHHAGGLRLILGAPRWGGHADALKALGRALTEAGIDAPIVEDIRLATWMKLQSQVGSAPIAVLTGATNGELETAPGIVDLKRAVSLESLAVAQAWNVPLKPEPNRASATDPSHKPSMLQDFEAGRPIELDAIVGAVIELARLKSVPVPTIEGIWAMARLRAETRRNAGCAL